MYELVVKEEKIIPEFQTIEYTFSLPEEFKGKTVSLQLVQDSYKKDMTVLNFKYLINDLEFKVYAKCLRPSGIRKFNVGELMGYLEVV